MDRCRLTFRVYSINSLPVFRKYSETSPFTMKVLTQRFFLPLFTGFVGAAKLAQAQETILWSCPRATSVEPIRFSRQPEMVDIGFSPQPPSNGGLLSAATIAPTTAHPGNE